MNPRGLNEGVMNLNVLMKGSWASVLPTRILEFCQIMDTGERLASLGIMGAYLRAPFNPSNMIVFRGVFIIPRGVLSHSRGKSCSGNVLFLKKTFFFNSEIYNSFIFF